MLPSQPVFTNKNGDKLNPIGLHKILKEILEKSALPPKRFSLIFVIYFDSVVTGK
jgi:hypothetical protein